MWNCQACGAENDEFQFQCSQCKTIKRRKPSIDTAPVVSTVPDASSRVQKLIRRYADAYIVAKATNGTGMIIKSVGISSAVLCCIAGFILYAKGVPTIERLALVVISVLVGAFFGILVMILGILVSTQSQILKATLDSAVNSSPLLTNEQRAKIMSLPDA